MQDDNYNSKPKFLKKSGKLPAEVLHNKTELKNVKESNSIAENEEPIRISLLTSADQDELKSKIFEDLGSKDQKNEKDFEMQEEKSDKIGKRIKIKFSMTSP